MILEFWYRKHHDEYEVTEVHTDEPVTFVANTMYRGAFWHDDVFTPWHSVSHVEIVRGK